MTPKLLECKEIDKGKDGENRENEGWEAAMVALMQGGNVGEDLGNEIPNKVEPECEGEPEGEKGPTEGQNLDFLERMSEEGGGKMS